MNDLFIFDGCNLMKSYHLYISIYDICIPLCSLPYGTWTSLILLMYTTTWGSFSLQCMYTYKPKYLLLLKEFNRSQPLHVSYSEGVKFPVNKGLRVITTYILLHSCSYVLQVQWKFDN